jgi:hypothetical protein
MDNMSGEKPYSFWEPKNHNNFWRTIMNRKIFTLVTLLVFVSVACSQSVLQKGASEEFESASQVEDKWSDTVIVTSKDDKAVDVSLKDGGLRFDLKANDSYVYRFYESGTYNDVSIETEVENLGLRNNGIALVCRANADRTEWIEFRVTNQGRYDLYHYDHELTYEYKNPYVELINTGNTDVFKPIKNNVIKATCNGNTYSLTVNDELIFEKEMQVIEGEGGVGVGAMAFDELPVSIVYKYVNIKKP